jgi:hypothetical protein
MKHPKSWMLLPSLILIFGLPAWAEFDLSKSALPVVCYGEGNVSVTLGSKKQEMQYVMKGESHGAQKILRVETDHQSFIAYVTEEGTLTLSNQGDSYRYADNGDSAPLNCE